MISNLLKLILLIYLSLNVLMTTISTSDSSKLSLVFMVHRHGDRTPIQCYPTDPYSNASFWPDGWGRLTPYGKDRMFQLGQYIRQRYDNFLSTSPREVHIRSSASDRCLESVALVLAGLYKPEGRWQWDQTLGKMWQPFPIQTEPRPLDGMLNSGSHCVTAEQELVRIHNSPEVLEYTQQKKGILNYVSGNTGRNVSDLLSAEEIFDTLLIEKENSFNLPRWVDESTYQNLQQISDMTFYFDYSTKLIQRLRTGLLLKDIIQRIENVIQINKTISDPQNESSDKKIYIYSTHDTQIALLLNALNVFDKKSPPFGSTILIELYETTGDPLIKFYYLNDTLSKQPIPLILQNCTNANNECLFSKFVDSVNDLLPIDWNLECNNSQTLHSNTEVMSYLFGSLLTLSILGVIYILYTFLRSKKTEIVYQMLPIN